jgi:NAD(P)-dependent dehydrogenase (short-subunit alcohol dehydrogenase family)
MVFADATGLGQQVAKRLRELGHAVSVVLPGGSFRGVGETDFELAPAAREDYDLLLRQVASGRGLPERILHLWSVSEGPVPEAAARDLGFHSLLCLAQALGAAGLKEKSHLAVVSSHLQAVGGEPFRCPEKATLLGPTMVIPREYPNLITASVDVLVPTADDGSGAELVDQLIAEAQALEAGAQVALRQGERWLRAYQAVHLDRAVPEGFPIRHGGTYLITGGLGGFGLTFAEYLGREHAANLVLLGRSELPRPEEWEQWLSEHSEDEPIASKIRRLQELRDLGIEVLAVHADSQDHDRLEEVLRQVEERFGTLNGVIHAAGVAGGGLIQLKTREAADKVLVPKVEGTLALTAALGKRRLDFFLLCSSTIATLGTPGQVDYAAGNCFLDAFAEAARVAGNPSRVISLNWGAWSDVGMAVETRSPASLRADAGAALVPAEGVVHADDEAIPAPNAAMDASAGGEVSPISAHGIHPLLDQCLEQSDDAAVYASQLVAAERWVLAEHRILGTPALPGTTYLELARAAYAHHVGGDGRAKLRQVYFYQPLMAPEGESRELRLHLQRIDSSQEFEFRVVSRAAGSEPWLDHARGKVGPLLESQVKTVDLEGIQQRCPRQVEALGEMAEGNEKLVYWGPRWGSLEEIHLGDREGLAKLCLPDEFAVDLVGGLTGLGLHPALLDVATALTSGLSEGVSYLPFSYRQVEVLAPIPALCYSHLRLRDEAVGGETASADISLLDSQGREVVRIEHFTMKKVGAAREKLQRGQAEGNMAAQEKSTVGLFAAEGMSPAQGVEAMRRVLSRLRRPRVLVSPKDIYTLLEEVAAGPDLTRASGGAHPEGQASHPRPNMPTPYLAPRTPQEEKLAEIWQQVLGLEQVGVNDNFFDLGGDSVLGITVISQSAEAGFQLSPEQLFEHQTVAELAAVLAASGPDPDTSGAVGPAESDGLTDSAESPDFADSGLAEDELEKVLAKLQEIS